ncbi:Zn-dependent hydrolase [Roseomonas sp. OT10]|uniref:Zn-dependent hydrolase n=1 Tax=Roseomonas cutis TaxID=2897332 RepID=UPI001E50C2FF|nr:Zn-dependent hydrolase [Roseomonas sp. OT10]UFN48375.1 Zn-dependent hydrolase [Roseomonas sp. OT10]
MTNLLPDTELAATLFARLHAATADPAGGVTREAYGPGENAAHALVREAGEGIGLEARTDPAGNLYLTLPGADRAARRVVFGSHLDSVPRGGDYDGVAGVLAGLAVVSGLRRAGFVPPRDITVMAIRAEEAGAWFPFGCPGSRAALGMLPPEALAVRRMDAPVTLGEAMRAAGFDPDWCARGEAALTPRDTAAFVELHIEQGPVLEAEGLPVALVTGIPGSRRHRFARVLGEWNHSGATPRRYRRDAAAALAELAYRLEQEWIALEAEGRELVCTFCVMATAAEAGFTKIAGEAEFKLDVRSVDQEALDRLFAALHRLVAEIGARRGVRFELGPESAGTPTPLDPALLEGLGQAARMLGVPHRRMPSGGGHDASAFQKAGIPSAMLFVRNQNGSHNPDEAMRIEDFDAACRVLMRWVTQGEDPRTPA